MRRCHPAANRRAKSRVHPTSRLPSNSAQRRWNLRRRPLQRLYDECVDAFATARGGGSDPAMQLGRYPHREIPRISPVRLFAALPAPVDVIGDGIGEGDLQLIERPPLEGQHIARVDHLTVKQPGLLVEFYGRDIAIMGHRGHGITPASRKNLRTDLRAPLSVSFAGCGRWNTASTPFRLTRTRDPRPSEIAAPAAMNSASTSAHGSLARTGSAKTACRVVRCLPRTVYDTRIRYQSPGR